ncbi:A/G-specific adenine glycosylase [Ketobacter sp. MCCC 1A13808]|uniref:A/G-specific adenine glycosylase n=1 Tax=Ketobacter sp. MCCC 1A13808 TaxID=2602738 RepID=UPI0013215BF3|nr:A/G-specific adenine glycosylase [Ketobacter sp. MCCC 1A13808]MVF13902.1 A/G-specific adenine glycosylase [Ketobacter sp. MCCC 1A13808]
MSVLNKAHLPAPEEFQQRILNWYSQFGRRDLPWQIDISPYRVWVSEIMLQQTQVTTVIPYFQRFMARFRTVETLAASSVDEVLQHWAGLGYYARGRNLHKAARQVTEQFQGQFPRSVDELILLPGIGRSTAGAIASISMGTAAPILDGNVKRVLTRLHAVAGWPGQKKVSDQLWMIAEHYTEQRQTRQYTQAMMDLGATLCTRSRPACTVCPVVDLCAAAGQGNPTVYPHSKPKKAKPEKRTWMLIMQYRDETLLYKRPDNGIWGGLWSFPEFPSEQDLLAGLHDYRLDQTDAITRLPAFRHTFSHYHLDIHPVQVRVDHKPRQVMEGQDQVWYNEPQITQLGFAAPIKKLIHQLTETV